jgi:hypothetical protein
MGSESISRAEIDALLAQAGTIHGELYGLQEECGAYLEQLAAVEWEELAGQGKLAGVSKFLIERAIADARHVLVNGQQDLDDIRRQSQAPSEQFVERLQALIRLYTDAPADIRTRYARLREWVAQIDRNWQEHGETPLSARLG